MRTAAVVSKPAPRREPAPARPERGRQASTARLRGAHDRAAVAAARAGDPRALSSAHPDTIRRLQRSVGNAGLASAFGERTGARAQAPAVLVQRENGDGDGVVEAVKRGTPVVTSLVGEASNIVGTWGSATGRGYDTPATYVGAGVGLLATGIELLGTADESMAAMRVLLDPAQSQNAQEAALETLGDSVLKVWSAKDSIVSNAGQIASTAQPHVAMLTTVASAAGMVAAYGEFAASLVDWGKDWERMVGIQELQFTGWNDPAAAAREARRDSVRAWGLLAGAQDIFGAATKVQVANERTLAAASESKDLRIGAVGAMAQDIATRRVGAEQDEERHLALESEHDGLARARAAYDEIHAENMMSRRAVAAAEARIAQARQMITLATIKEDAVAVFVDELAKAVALMHDSPDPQGRPVTLEEIRMFAVSQSEKKLTRDTLRTIAAVIGVAAGIAVLSLGWTPVGWGLVTAAGAIGATILIVKGGRMLLRMITGTLTPREVYAQRLWEYAHFGYDVSGRAHAPPKDVRLRNGADAIGLLRALGISWSQQDVLARPAHDRNSISAIESALKW